MLGFVLMLMCVGLVFTSCGDDEEELDPDNPIVGNWLTEEQNGFYAECIFKKNGEYAVVTHVPDELLANEFIKKGFELTRPKIDGKYSTNGNKLTLTVTTCKVGEVDMLKMIKVPTQTGTYFVSKDNKTITLVLKYKDYYTGESVTEKYTRK